MGDGLRNRYCMEARKFVSGQTKTVAATNFLIFFNPVLFN